MSEYWKSVPRKFCDFCKCWITDNRPSVEFHERGKRHQENVELRLKEVRKKSLQNSFDQKQLERDMQKMEKAALEAFKKDLKDNPELAAQYGVSLEPKPKPEAEKSEEAESSQPKESSGGKKSKKRKRGTDKEWYEAVTPEGFSYYWSTKTGESTWTTPKEYVSIVEQAEAENPKTEKADKSEETSDTTTAPSGPATAGQTVDSQVSQRTGFGSWEVVKEEKQPEVYDETSVPPELGDIPLPSVSGSAGSTSQPKTEKPKFKERTVASLGTTRQPGQCEPVAFKKRKVAAGARNVRQRDND